MELPPIVGMKRNDGILCEQKTLHSLCASVSPGCCFVVPIRCAAGTFIERAIFDSISYRSKPGSSGTSRGSKGRICFTENDLSIPNYFRDIGSNGTTKPLIIVASVCILR